MEHEHELGASAKYRGRPVTIVSRVWVNGGWLYGLRLASGHVVDYIPARLVR
jgi:hypothetical protein